MILGFAHITDNWEGHTLFPGVSFVVPSPSEKWPLMANQAKSHNLLIRPRRGVMTEIVRYDTGVVMKPGRLRLGASSDIILIDARDPDAEAAFTIYGLGFNEVGAGFKAISLRDAGRALEFRSQVSRWCLDVGVMQKADAPIDPPLDIAGYAALAFYSSDVEADRDHLLKHGGRTPTEPFTVKLDREMKIVMLRSPEGTIIELIQVVK